MKRLIVCLELFCKWIEQKADAGLNRIMEATAKVE